MGLEAEKMLDSLTVENTEDQEYICQAPNGLARVVDTETTRLNYKEKEAQILTCSFIDILTTTTKDKPNEKAKPMFKLAADGSREKVYLEKIVKVAERTLWFWDKSYVDVGRSDLHHLTEDIMKPHESEFKENLIQLAALVNYNDIITFNGDSFDIPYIYAFLSKHNAEIDEDDFRVNSIDIRSLAGPIYRKENGIAGDKHGRLIDIYTWLNKGNTDNITFHQSIDDCRATLFIMEKILKGEY